MWGMLELKALNKAVFAFFWCTHRAPSQGSSSYSFGSSGRDANLGGLRYGHVFPTTDLGRGVLVVYCLLAIPLMSLYLLDVSIRLSKAIEKLYRLYRRSVLRPATKVLNLLRPLSAASTSTTVSICSISPSGSKIDLANKIFITASSEVVRHQCNKAKKRSVHQHGQKTKTDNFGDKWYFEKNMDIDDAKRKRKLKPLKHCDTSPLLIPTSNTRHIVVKSNHRKRSCNLKIRKASAADEQKNRKRSRLLAPTQKSTNNNKPNIVVEPALLTVPNFILTPRMDYMDDFKLSDARRTSNETTMGYLLNSEERLSK
uniref:Potassium channel domain-containing protein n=1 Tax=Romanomermis culicivorax TaxID=13658 RepID=A0A915IQ88_ROMCU